LVGQVDFDGGHYEERDPDVEELRFSVVALFFGDPGGDGYLIRFHGLLLKEREKQIPRYARNDSVVCCGRNDSLEWCGRNHMCA
jgi:hypothetical protein